MFLSSTSFPSQVLQCFCYYYFLRRVSEVASSSVIPSPHSPADVASVGLHNNLFNAVIALSRWTTNASWNGKPEPPLGKKVSPSASVMHVRLWMLVTSRHCVFSTPWENRGMDRDPSISQMEFAIGYLQWIILSLLIVMNCGVQISIRDCSEAIQLRPKTRSLISAWSLIMQMTSYK